MGKCWDKFQTCFGNILQENDYYSKQLVFLKNIDRNVLLYGACGFPTDLFIDEMMKNNFSLKHLSKQECSINKDIKYLHHPCFIEVDLSHPSCSKNISNLFKFIIGVIVNKNIHNAKHIIIIKHIDVLKPIEYNSLRILLEKYSKNANFVCSTHKLDKIDVPVKSRFTLLRMPLFKHTEIKDIFYNKLNTELNTFLIAMKTRDIIYAIFIHDISDESGDITEDFVTLRFPPIKLFLLSFKKHKNNLISIREFSYKCFQYNISIVDILCDMLKLVSSDKKNKIIQCAANIDHILNTTNKGRESLYIESLLCQVLL
jgi:DNA polymerase III delta prime subunit